VALLGAGVFAAGHGASRVHTAYRDFVSSADVPAELTTTQRLGQLGNNGRLELWRVAVDDSFAGRPVTGSGAGTFELERERHATATAPVLDAHSLYAESLGELGLPGLVLVLLAVVPLLVAIAVRTRGPDGAPWTALLAAGVAWALHAGVDWDWEMTAITAWIFAAGGMALARDADGVAPSPGGPSRWVAPAGALALALVPTAFGWSSLHADRAMTALRRGDCATARSAADLATKPTDVLPAPHEVLAFCLARAGNSAGALLEVREAIRRDRGAWRYRYTEALVLAAAGRDPHAAMRAARERNPHSAVLRVMTSELGSDDPATWRKVAPRAPVILPPEHPLPDAAL
jgi:hypothetical protein